MFHKPKTAPVQVEVVKVWTPKQPSDAIAGTIVGSLGTDFGPAFVIEGEQGQRFRLPNNSDLIRKVEGAMVTDPTPYLEIEYKGLDPEDGRTKIYQVMHYPKG